MGFVLLATVHGVIAFRFFLSNYPASIRGRGFLPEVDFVGTFGRPQRRGPDGEHKDTTIFLQVTVIVHVSEKIREARMGASPADMPEKLTDKSETAADGSEQTSGKSEEVGGGVGQAVGVDERALDKVASAGGAPE